MHLKTIIEMLALPNIEVLRKLFHPENSLA